MVKLVSTEIDTTTAQERSQALATAILEIYRSNVFYASMIQSIEISYSMSIPTAGVSFSADNKKYVMFINPNFFIKRLTPENRKAVMMHEIMHLVHRHLNRIPMFKLSPHNMRLMNIAADLAINSYIKDLPQGCPQCPPIDSGAKCPNSECPGHAFYPHNMLDEVDGNKVPWKSGMTMEQYFMKLKERYEETEDGDGDGDDDGGAGKGGKPSKKKMPGEFDSHAWEANADEHEMLDALEELVKRSMIKSSMEYGSAPELVRDLLDNIKARKAELNYKALILAAIKRSASGQDRKYSWSRKSRRFPNIAPGTKVGELPSMRIVIDTSGSISTVTINEFLETVDAFLKHGNRKCSLHLFSDNEYHSQPYKMGDRVGQETLRSSVKIGGTDLEDSLKNVLRHSPDLTLVLTDGAFSDVDVESWLKPNQRFPEVLWVIEKDGTENHPFAKRSWSRTIKIPG